MKTKLSFLSLFVALAALTFQSCTSDKTADAGDILNTIPSDVSFVAVINTGNILEQSGCKIKDGTMTPGKDLTEAVSKIEDQNIKGFFTAFITGESGINPSVMVLFRDGYNNYLTGVASDPSQMQKTLTANGYPEFTTENGVKISRNVAIADNRFWVNVTGTYIEPKDVLHYKSLSGSQSFMQNSYAEKLTTVTSDISGWGNIGGILNTAGIDFEKRAYAQIVLQTLFEDPTAFTFTVNSEKGSFDCNMSVLNSKGQTAKYLLPVEKLNLTTIESLGGTADGLFAISIPKKLIDKLQKDTNSKTPSLMSLYLSKLGCLDGTAVIATGNGEDVNGVMTTTGKDTGVLTTIMGSAGFKTTLDGNLLRFSKGEAKGKVNVADIAKEFKGAVAGVYSTQLGNFEKLNILEYQTLLLMPEGNGLMIKFKGVTKDKKENAILTWLKNYPNEGN